MCRYWRKAYYDPSRARSSRRFAFQRGARDTKHQHLIVHISHEKTHVTTHLRPRATTQIHHPTHPATKSANPSSKPRMLLNNKPTSPHRSYLFLAHQARPAPVPPSLAVRASARVDATNRETAGEGRRRGCSRVKCMVDRHVGEKRKKKEGGTYGCGLLNCEK